MTDRLQNLTNHLQTIKVEMKKVQDKFTENEILPANTIIDLQKKYNNLQYCLDFVMQMKATIFPPKIIPANRIEQNGLHLPEN